MAHPVIFGDVSSLVVRAILIALAEKGISYGIADAADQSQPDSCGALPGETVLEHGGFLVRGAESILRYVDEALPGPRLQPEAPRQRARMNWALEVHFGEAVPILGARIVGRRLEAAFTGEWIAPTLPERLSAQALRTTSRLAEVLGGGPFLAGDMVSLADAALAPLFACLMPLPEAESLISPTSPLRSWWRLMSERASFRGTRPKGGLLSAILPTL
jgi:glutathione S-transferase